MCFLAVIGFLRPTTDFETLRKDPKLVFQFVNDKISSVNVNITAFPPWELKHMVWVFSQSLKVSGWPQTAYHSQKAHQRRQLLRMPRGDSGGLGCCRV